jgi:predicted nucleic acid-binding protein
LSVINLHNNGSPKSGNYILDSNVWLPILGIDDEPSSDHYKIFFSKIFKADDLKIILCSIQLSEILNRLLRFHANKLYTKKYDGRGTQVPARATFYKQEYRKSEDFKLRYDTIIDDLQGYNSHILMSDLKQTDFDALTSFDAGRLDFNDHYMYLLAKEQSATIITHDADFFGLDIEVGTFNLKLYKLYTSTIRPK